MTKQASKASKQASKASKQSKQAKQASKASKASKQSKQAKQAKQASKQSKQAKQASNVREREQAEQAQTITLSKIGSRGSEIPSKEIIRDFFFDLGGLFFGGPFRQRRPDFILPKIVSRGSESGERRPAGDLAKIPRGGGAPRKNNKEWPRRLGPKIGRFPA